MKNEVFVVEGRQRLQGELIPQGAKNEALQVLCAVILTNEKVYIKNLPATLDILKQIEILEILGVKIEKKTENEYVFCAEDVKVEKIFDPKYQQAARKIRGSVMLLGALLARFKKAVLPEPGGDKIGRRRMDTHLIGFGDLGAKFTYDSQAKSYQIEGSAMKSGFVQLEEASVTGTANMILCSVFLPGKTQIYNAACEPYLQQLCQMLSKMGAKITGIGSNLLTIEGVKQLGGCDHQVLPDMIEIGSFIGMAAMTQSDLLIKNVAYSSLGIMPKIFQKMGVALERKGEDLMVYGSQKYKIQNFIDGSILTISDAPWPGFTPDLISIVLVMAIQAEGSVLIHQKMFESRLFFVDKLIDMGGKIILCDPHRAIVIGQGHQTALRGIQMSSPDIRAGIALLIAALSAEGQSIIHNIDQIDRGYQNLLPRLQALGAKIQRKTIDE